MKNVVSNDTAIADPDLRPALQGFIDQLRANGTPITAGDVAATAIEHGCDPDRARIYGEMAVRLAGGAE